ncbi:ExeM/NucH family extracellular endonuclease [Nocardioides marinquilinus]|uniref:ExeM/NucH family extracellular endonuclease n=1 Tax=Nocardioides marinquilinus TaxID=1210400 RepID=UPI0031E5A8A8
MINEVYINGGSASATYKSKYVEIRNLSSSAVDFSTTPMSVQYRAPGSTGSSTGVAALTGTIPGNGYYVVVGGSNGSIGADVPASPGQTSTNINPGNAGGTMTLVTGTTAVDPSSSTAVVDKLGWGTSNAPEGTAATGNSVTKSIGRVNATDTDANSTDFASQDPTPGASNTGGSSALSATNPGNKSAVLNEAITPFQLQASGGSGSYTWTVTGLPPGITASSSGQVSGTPTTTTGSPFSVTATVSDGSATAQTTFTYTVSATLAITPIAQIQGTDTDTSPLSGQTVTTEGIVTAQYASGAGNYNGIYIQTPGTGGTADATPGASDAIFVFGANSQPSGVAIGDTVRVTGPVSEFSGTTEITPASGGVTKIAAKAPVTPAAIAYPGTDAGREAHEGELLAPTGPFTVSNVYSITGGANAFASIGLASGTKPLIQPTDVEDAQNGDTAGVVADNAARAVVLDDGSSANYMSSANQALPLPWITNNANPPRMGAPVTFTGPVILEYRDSAWKFQPTQRITGNGANTATFGTDRANNLQPAPVGGDLKLSTFNVLNYFPTTGEAYVASGAGTCTYFTDRNGNRVAVNSCTGNGPRGAAQQDDFIAQQAKIVDAINTIDADIVSLEEIENSVKMPGSPNRDQAVQTLVTALNADAGGPTARWAFVPSPSVLPTLAEQDVIRTAFIYNPSTVDLVGASQVLTTAPAFNNAREPLAQAFKPKGEPDSSAFGVIVNHFKSKGSGTDDGTGQGNANPDRVNQATALATFANDFKASRSVDAMFLVGDFNAYTQEDPMQVLYDAGYENLASEDPTDASYSFDGLSGSLDHVLANTAAQDVTTGSDIWEINANESLAYQYSRRNYHGEDYYAATPWSSSDHNPEVVGISVAERVAATVTAADQTVNVGSDAVIPVTVTGTAGTPTGSVTISNGADTLGTGQLVNGTANVVTDTSGLAKGTYTLVVDYSGDAAYDAGTDTLQLTVQEPATRTIQILATNDFHGRLLNNQAGAPGSQTGNPAGPNTSTDGQAGAAVLSGAVKQLRGENPDTVFAAAGDLIGASTFESFIQDDEPTIDALNEAGLEVSAAGNHEFDKGYEDLVGRVQDRADWEYIAANVNEPNGRNDLMDTWGKTFGDVKVGFVGAVTEDLPSLVSPAGIQGVTVDDIVDSTNAAANALKAGGADLVVLLVHEGSPSTSCATMTDPATTWGNIVVNTSADVDAIVSGHTHLAYNCSFPVTGKTVERPVVSAGQYGTNLNQLKFVVDTQTGVVQSKTQALLPLKNSTTPFAPLYPADPDVVPIVNDAINQAAVLGAVEVGKIEAPLSRAKFGDGTRENRGGESTLGNLVAEIQRWATRNPESGSAQIAFMNPGGLRADLAGNGSNPSRTVTYRDAANVQPFANTLVNMRLTGAQIETVLEQQWQLTAAGIVPTRPFLKLGQSEGFEYTYDTAVLPTPSTTDGAATYTQGEITSMKLNGVELDPTQTYSVTVNSFLASGGDNFRELNNGTQKRDTGKADLQAQVDYFEQVVGTTPLEVDYSQRAVGVKFPNPNDTTYRPGETVSFDLSSLIMTGNAGSQADVKDAQVTVSLGETVLGTYTVDQTIPNPGTGTGQADGASTDESGKASVSFVLPANAPGGVQTLTVKGATTGTEIGLPITVERFATTVTGTASPVSAGQDASVLVTVDATNSDEVPTGTVEIRDGDTVVGTGTLTNGSATITVDGDALVPGDNELTLAYLGDGAFDASTGTVTISVAKVATTVSGTADPVTYGDTATVIVTVTPGQDYGDPTGTVTLLNGTTEVGSVELVDGTGNITVPAASLEVGSNAFTLSYEGDDTYEPSTGSVSVPVTKVNANVTGESAQITYGQPGAITVSVGPESRKPATGTVTVKNGDTVIGTASLENGTATVPVAALSLAPGQYTFDLEYSGDDNYTSDTGSVTVTVVKAAATVSATVTPAKPVVGKDRARVAVTVNATGVTPTGTVEVRQGTKVLGSATLSSGKATIVLPVFKTAGNQALQVRYLGDANVAAAATPKTVSVAKATPSMTVTAPAKVKRNATPTVSVKLAATGLTVTGKVQFKYNGRTVTKTLSGQKASLKLAKLTKNTTVTVVYVGNANLNKKTASKTIKVG